MRKDLKELNDFIDRKLPYKIQYILSETLHGFMDYKLRRRLSE